MKAFITTVAGMSSRFSKDFSKPVLKCIYYHDKPENTLLYRMLAFAEGYDVLVIVGGFQYDCLQKYIHDFIPAYLQEKIILVENMEYTCYGSGWSLYKGISVLRQTGHEYCEILFAEGDLYVDKESFRKIISSNKNVITANNEPIMAQNAVAFYFDLNGIPHYIYDTVHGSLEIKEPFISIYNSGQIWKFRDVPLLFALLEKIGERQQTGTNLTLINEYLISAAERNAPVEIMRIYQWINCNTVSDFNRAEF